MKKAKEAKLNERNLITNKLPVQSNPLKNSIQNNSKKSESAGDEQVIKKIDKLKIENLSSEIVKEREQFWAEQEAEERRQREEENRRRLLEKRAIENEIRNCENNAKQIVNTFNNPSNTNSTVKKINAIDEINLEKKKVLSSIKNSLNSNDKENAEVNIPEEDVLADDDLTDEIVIHEEEEESLSEADINNRTFTKQAAVGAEYYKLRAEFFGPSGAQPPQLADQRINEEDEVYDDEEYENEYCLDNGLTSYTSYLSKRLSNEPLEDILEEDENAQEDELSDLVEGKGKCARALFDYQASDETEISFLPNDIITHIEQVYEDNTSWLKGRTKDGKEGLFPANHCELIN